jgi:transposase
MAEAEKNKSARELEQKERSQLTEAERERVKILQRLITERWPCLNKVDIPEELKTKENVQMTQKKRQIFTEEQKAEAVRLVEKSDKSIHQVTEEMGLSESALRRWIKQAQSNQQPVSAGELTSAERKELITLRRDLKRVEMERDFLKKVATFFAKDGSGPMS